MLQMRVDSVSGDCDGHPPRTPGHCAPVMVRPSPLHPGILACVWEGQQRQGPGGGPFPVGESQVGTAGSQEAWFLEEKRSSPFSSCRKQPRDEQEERGKQVNQSFSEPVLSASCVPVGGC